MLMILLGESVNIILLVGFLESGYCTVMSSVIP